MDPTTSTETSSFPAPAAAQRASSHASHPAAASAPRAPVRRMLGRAASTTPAIHASSGGSPAMRMLTWGLAAMLGLGALAVATGIVDLDGPAGSATELPGGSDRDGSWSYYHDRDYETKASGAKWDTDRSRSSDPDEAVLGDTSRWEYDGPYRYGPYGSDGMRRRAAGRETADPLYSQPAPIGDVFSTYGGDLDPSGGQPVGVAPSRMTNPYYDPYAGYSNPYANRIRLAYGEGVGRGASYDPLP